MNKVALLRQHIDVANGRGLEIGPLVSPAVTREMGEIYYADHATTDELREWYRRDANVDESQIVEVDFVWGDRTLAEAAASKVPFDYVVASHVVEHVPDLIGWLQEIREILRPGGRLSLCVPDRRFTFDVRRRESDLSDVVEAYLLRLRRPALRATFDHFYRIAPADAPALWRGEPAEDPPLNLEHALLAARTAASTDEYIDTHCWVFSDVSFAEVARNLMQAGLIDLRVVSFTPTRIDDIEFFVTFERPQDDCDPAERIRRNVASVPDVAATPGRPHHDPTRALKIRIQELETAVAGLQTTAASLNASALSRETLLKQLEDELSAIKGSASWRVTTPLRSLREAIRRRK